LKIVIDSNIPYIRNVFEQVAEVAYLPYHQITNETIRNADALIIRTRTKCNAQLLKGTSVKFIASATIGYDHIDADYCSAHGIKWTNAPGCNSLAVTQYIASALSFLVKKNHFDLSSQTIGVVGVGAVGSKVAELAASFGMQVLLNDPPRARREETEKFVSLKEVCEKADIITFHPLLNMSGIDKTYHLADENFFNDLQQKPIIINVARGEVISTEALLKAYEEGKISGMIMDCWENEPNINRELLMQCILGTPHIAGYSIEGKANAAAQSVKAVSKFFGLGLDNWEPTDLPEPFPLTTTSFDAPMDFFLQTYNIEADSQQLKSSPENFESHRSHYNFRREPKAYLDQLEEEIQKKFFEQFPIFFK